MKHSNHRWFQALPLLFVMILAACAGASKPTVSIVSAVDKSVIVENQLVTVQAMTVDTKGVIRVELAADNNVVSVASVNPPQKAVTVPLTWNAVGGTHKLTAHALNVDNVFSDSASITVTVSAPPAPPAPTAAPTTAPTAAPTQAPPTATAAANTPTAVATLPPTAVPCTKAAAFIADVTVPDGTPWAPNQAFNKIWRVRNSGTCAWGAGYQFVQVGGTTMSSVKLLAVPNTDPGKTADLLVAMTAPAAYGSYTGQWQFKDEGGVAFGPVFTVKIVVQSPQPTPLPGCQGTARISSFGADRVNINRGEATVLRWGPVTNAGSVSIDNGIGGVATPGERTIAPQQTTMYTLFAACGTNVQQAHVTVVVNGSGPVPPQPTAVPPSPTHPSISGNWSAGQYMMEISEAFGCSGSSCGLTGRLIHLTNGAPEISDMSGSYNGMNVSLTIPGTMPGAPTMTFNGTVNASGSSISGQLSGVGGLTFTRQ